MTRIWNSGTLAFELALLAAACGGSEAGGGSSGGAAGALTVGGGSGITGGTTNTHAAATGGATIGGSTVNATGGVGVGGTGGSTVHATGGAEVGGTGGSTVHATGGAEVGGTGGGTVHATGGVGVGGTGGTAVGGRSGTTGGSVGTGGNPYGADCVTASDCTLFSDCCTCAAVQAKKTMTLCVTVCDQSACAARGIGTNEVACISGRCVIDRSCNANAALCNMIAPSCPTGQAPLIAKDCYTGGCVPAAQCSEVTSCSDCIAAGLRCVTDQTMPPSFHCVTTPTMCSDYPSCDCMGVCLGALTCVDPYSVDLTCACPEC